MAEGVIEQDVEKPARYEYQKWEAEVDARIKSYGKETELMKELFAASKATVQAVIEASL